MAACFVAAAERPAAACGVALVLAVDVSSSISAEDYELIRAGHAAAFRDPAVVAAIRAAGGVQAALLHWSGATHQAVVAPWTALRGPGDVAVFARRLATAPRGPDGLMTAPAPALDAAGRLLDHPAAQFCERFVVDVSGDGARNDGAPVGPARARLLATGATINGLAIGHPLRLIGAEVDAWRFYESRLIGGPGAFVETIDDISGYRAAFRRKLLRELAIQVGRAAPAPGLDLADRVGRWPAGVGADAAESR